MCKIFPITPKAGKFSSQKLFQFTILVRIFFYQKCGVSKGQKWLYHRGIWGVTLKHVDFILGNGAQNHKLRKSSIARALDGLVHKIRGLIDHSHPKPIDPIPIGFNDLFAQLLGLWHMWFKMLPQGHILRVITVSRSFVSRFYQCFK